MTKHRKERQRRQDERQTPTGEPTSDRRQKPVEEPRPEQPTRQEEPKPIEGESEDIEL